MHPVLFHIGDFPIHTYGFAGALGFLLLAAIGIWRASSLGVSAERVADLIFWTALIGLAGSRVLYIYTNPAAMNTFWDWFNIRGGGLVFYGALLAGLPAASFLIYYYKMPFYGVWDAFSTALPLGHAITRLGCLGAGCCFGAPSNLPWAVIFTAPRSVAPQGISLHPTQVYEAVWLLFVGIVVNVVWSRRRFDGQVTLTYLLLYAGGRSVIEIFRGDTTRGYVMPELLGEAISTSQGISVVIAVFALVVFLGGALNAHRKKLIGASIEGPVEEEA
jgi:phosphatidylglycerol---prolipoprotein diacylglyceryl transferase